MTATLLNNTDWQGPIRWSGFGANGRGSKTKRCPYWARCRHRSKDSADDAPGSLGMARLAFLAYSPPLGIWSLEIIARIVGGRFTHLGLACELSARKIRLSAQIALLSSMGA